jgi:hypothetical protein
MSRPPREIRRLLAGVFLPTSKREERFIRVRRAALSHGKQGFTEGGLAVMRALRACCRFAALAG